MLASVGRQIPELVNLFAAESHCEMQRPFFVNFFKKQSVLWVKLSNKQRRKTMKTQLKKIIFGAAAVLFVMTGVSFAHDGDRRSHKPHGKGHGYYKVKKDHHHKEHRHYKPRKHYRKRHAHRDVHHRHYKPWKHYRKGHARRDVHHRHHYDKHHRYWKKSHAKFKRHHHDRYRYRKIRQHHHDSRHRRWAREDLIYKVALKDAGVVFKVILNGK